MIRLLAIRGLERVLFDKGSRGGGPPGRGGKGGGKYNPDGYGCGNKDKGGRAFMALIRYYRAGGRPRPYADAATY
jgi:hypothetical protein